LSFGGVAVWINEPIAATSTTICFQNKNYKKAKWLPGHSSTWFTTTDSLAGTEEKGVEGDDYSEWSILFDRAAISNFLFATSNFMNWAIVPVSSMTTTGGGKEERPITSSSINS